MDGVVLNRVGILELFCPKQGQGFRLSAAPLNSFMSEVRLPGRKTKRSFTPVLDAKHLS